MGVSAADLLKLPCLREAKVLAGKKGLCNTVSSITVLEYSDVNDIQNEMFNHIDFYGSELVITAFAYIKDDVELQCANIRRLAAVGEVGLILYYVGIILPKVDKRLIELADQLDFLLICMPERRYNLRYSEVIVEVMETIYKDRMTDTYFENEVLERVSRLPAHQRNVDTVMKMLSDRARACLVLVNTRDQVLNCISWPRNLELDAGILPPYGEEYSLPQKITLRGQTLWLCGVHVQMVEGDGLKLYILKQEEAVLENDAKQIGNLLRISINLWGHGHGKHVLPELVRAILQDEPVKMRRIAEIFNIDVASIHTMWIIMPLTAFVNTEERKKAEQTIQSISRRALSHRCKTVVADVYDERIVIFIDDTAMQDNLLQVGQALCDDLSQAGAPGLLTVCFHLSNTSEVRQAYLLNKNFIETARFIFPRRQLFTYSELKFAQKCRQIAEQGEQSVQQKLAILESLRREDRMDRHDLCETLAVYLLDAESNVTRTAQQMYLHKNTIKYRLGRINARLCCHVDKMPEAISLYTAVALQRILASQ